MAVKEYGVWICNVCKKELQAFTSSPSPMMDEKWVEQGNNFVCYECQQAQIKTEKLDDLLKRINKRNQKMVSWPGMSGPYDPHLFDYKWTCPHCGSKASISTWFNIDDDKIEILKLRYKCYTCGRQRYEKIPDIIEENGESYIED